MDQLHAFIMDQLHAFVAFIEMYEKFFVAIGTLFIAAFTVILAFATAFLWGATRQLVKGADDTAKRQLRAYVFVDSVNVANVVEGSGPPESRVIIKNFGQTPAYQVTCVDWIAL